MIEFKKNLKITKHDQKKVLLKHISRNVRMSLTSIFVHFRAFRVKMFFSFFFHFVIYKWWRGGGYQSLGDVFTMLSRFFLNGLPERSLSTFCFFKSIEHWMVFSLLKVGYFVNAFCLNICNKTNKGRFMDELWQKKSYTDILPDIFPQFMNTWCMYVPQH